MNTTNRNRICSRTGRLRSGSPRYRCGLTLLELLVVLVVLAIVATVAVNSLQPRVETARFDQTRKLIENIRNSVIGQRGSRQTDGTPLISGFVADTGRLPRPGGLAPNFLFDPNQSLEKTDSGQELHELWNTGSRIASQYPFRFRSGPTSPVDYSAIQLPCGWRGPYLHLGLGQTDVRDPWGRPLQYELDGKGCIQCITWQAIGNYETDLDCLLKTGKVAVTGTINFGQSEPSQVEAVLLAPDPDSSLSELGVFADEDTNPLTFAFNDVTVGLRAIHIRVDDRTVTRYVQVPHEGLNMVIDMTDTQSRTSVQSETLENESPSSNNSSQ